MLKITSCIHVSVCFLFYNCHLLDCIRFANCATLHHTYQITLQVYISCRVYFHCVCSHKSSQNMCLHTHAHAHAHTRTHTHTHTCTHACMHTCIHARTHVRTHTHTHTRVCTRTYTHTPAEQPQLCCKYGRPLQLPAQCFSAAL